MAAHEDLTSARIIGEYVNLANDFHTMVALLILRDEFRTSVASVFQKHTCLCHSSGRRRGGGGGMELICEGASSR